jgi:hypothetical protein
MRDGNKGRPVTVQIGSNQIVGNDTERIIPAFRQAVKGGWREPESPPFFYEGIKI